MSVRSLGRGKREGKKAGDPACFSLEAVRAEAVPPGILQSPAFIFEARGKKGKKRRGERKGWSESNFIIRCWIAALGLSLFEGRKGG